MGISGDMPPCPPSLRPGTFCEQSLSSKIKNLHGGIQNRKTGFTGSRKPSFFLKKTSSYPVISFSGKSRAALPSSGELHGRT